MLVDLKLKWKVPCSKESVITFPSVPLLKPWYWWSWPILPLGLEWHNQRLETIGYFYLLALTTVAACIPPIMEANKVNVLMVSQVWF